jgi:16S rRNA (cytosine1402-N4)-methyltransferase
MTELEASPPHEPVLLEQVLELMRPQPGASYIALDCTVGAGGHARGLLERSAPDGRVIGLDADPRAVELARERLAMYGERFTAHNTNFRYLGELQLPRINGVLFDLGLSSMQLETSGRGFAIRGADQPLDMRFDPATHQATARDLLNDLPERELERVLREYGEEPRARRVAHAIVERRPLEHTSDLVHAVTAALGPARGRIHPATRTFQALRIAVNDELGALDTALEAALHLLKPAGRVVAISFHSLEDRLVKWRFRAWAESRQARILTRKPIQADEQEVARNPRARSAKLRAIERPE